MWTIQFSVGKIYLSVFWGVSCVGTEVLYSVNLSRSPFLPCVANSLSTPWYALGTASCLLRRARTDFTSSAVQGDYTVFTGSRHLEILLCLLKLIICFQV